MLVAEVGQEPGHGERGERQGEERSSLHFKSFLKLDRRCDSLQPLLPLLSFCSCHHLRLPLSCSIDNPLTLYASAPWLPSQPTIILQLSSNSNARLQPHAHPIVKLHLPPSPSHPSPPGHLPRLGYTVYTTLLQLLRVQQTRKLIAPGDKRARTDSCNSLLATPSPSLIRVRGQSMVVKAKL